MSESLRLPWRDERPGSSGQTADQDAVASSSDVEGEAQERGFVVHKVQRLDTLAGIAIKYSVPVCCRALGAVAGAAVMFAMSRLSKTADAWLFHRTLQWLHLQIADVKRFNGLLSDTAIHARGKLLIPTQLEPVSDEVRSMFVEVATGLGRNPVIHSDAAGPALPALNGSLQTSTLPVSTLPASASVGVFERDPLAKGESAMPWWCQCGKCSEEADLAYTCPQSTFHQMEGTRDLLIPPSQHSSEGPTRFHEQVRRRNRTTHEADGEEGVGAALRQWASDLGQEVQNSRLGSLLSSGGHSSSGEGATSAASAAGAVFSSIGKAIRESAVVQKLKQGASPGAPGRSSSLAGAADGIMASLRQGLLPKGNPAQFRVTNSPRSLTGVSFQKLGAKCD